MTNVKSRVSANTTTTTTTTTTRESIYILFSSSRGAYCWRFVRCWLRFSFPLSLSLSLALFHSRSRSFPTLTSTSATMKTRGKKENYKTQPNLLNCNLTSLCSKENMFNHYFVFAYLSHFSRTQHVTCVFLFSFSVYIYVVFFFLHVYAHTNSNLKITSRFLSILFCFCLPHNCV